MAGIHCADGEEEESGTYCADGEEEESGTHLHAAYQKVGQILAVQKIVIMVLVTHFAV